jgi:CTP:molybdopterin cytidylyltransferase MocA
VLLADQPGIEPAVLEVVIDRFGQTEKGIVQAAIQFGGSGK